MLLYIIHNNTQTQRILSGFKVLRHFLSSNNKHVLFAIINTSIVLIHNDGDKYLKDIQSETPAKMQPRVFLLKLPESNCSLKA